MRTREHVGRIVEWGASLRATPMQLGGLFAATVILRNLLEAATLGILFEAPAFFLHFPVAYVFPMLGLSALMHISSGYPLWKLMKIMVMAWTLTLLPPVIDFLAGVTGDIGYFPLRSDNAGWFLINFYNPAALLPGTTPGIRIEAFLGCVLAGVFSWCVTPGRKRALRGVLTTLVFMPIFLVFFTWPYLVQIIAERFFPVQESAQRFMQWHSFTELPLHGSAHFTIFTFDMLPVTLLAGWMLAKLAPLQFASLRRNMADLLPGILIAAVGTVAAFSGAPSGGLTFADAVSLVGALLAVTWLLGSVHLEGAFRTTAFAVSLLLAWASGWNTVVAIALTAALLNLPGGKRLSRAAAAPVVLFAALSPAGFPAPSLPLFLLAAASCIMWLLQRSWKATVPIALAMMLLGRLLPPEGLDSGRLQGIERQADSFFRSGMVAHGNASAMRVAASGGGFRTLAEGAHLLGMQNRAEWAYEVGTALGDTSVEMMKVGVNLASTMGDSLLLWTRALAYMDAAGERGADAAELLLGFAAARGDTAFLGRAHAGGGLSEHLLVLYSRAHMTLGDTLRAESFSRAALSHPSAGQASWAYAIELAGMTGGNSDSLYRRSVERFGFSLDIALSRLRVGISDDEGGQELEALLNRCLVLNPENPAVLETAATWHLAKGEPQKAMEFALRALATQMVPSPGAFTLAIRAAEAAGRNDIAASCRRYAGSRYR